MQKPVMYILANKGLGMSPGKLAAQVAHAAVRAVWIGKDSGTGPINEWLSKGETKVVLEARDTEHLLNAERYLRDKGFNTYLVVDEGRTEIQPHTPTCFAVGPVDKLDPVVVSSFEDFKTYREPKLEADNFVSASALARFFDGDPVFFPRRRSPKLRHD